jgi:ATP-dependent RNA helicase DDX46/PRP5
MFPLSPSLFAGFLAKVRSGAAKSHSGTGFGGKGLDRLDTDRESKEQAERSHFGEDKDDKKKDDDKDGADGKDKDGSGEFQLPGFNVDIVKGPAPERVGMSGGSRGGAAARTAVAPAQQHRPITLKAQGPNQEGVNKVQAALDKINAELARTKAAKSAAAGAERGGPAPASDAQATGGASSSVSGGISRNVAPSDGRKPKDPDATDYHAFVQINDFVQKARWMVTNRESMTKLIDMTGAAITNRESSAHSSFLSWSLLADHFFTHVPGGIYYEPGKEPPPGAEGKLSLLIESNDEWRVETAVREIKRLLIEGTIAGLAHAERTGQQMTTGRYKVE